MGCCRSAPASPHSAVYKEINAEERFVNPQSIYNALQKNEHGMFPVRLVRSSWLIKRAEKIKRLGSDLGARRALAIPRRQDLPEEAFMSVEDVIKNEPEDYLMRVAVVSISYCWRSPEHPDPEGQTIVEIAQKLKQYQGYRGKSEGPDGKYNILMSWPKEVGAFFDYCSMFQKDSAGHRSDAEQACFDASIKDLDLFYAHQCTTSFLFTDIGVTPRYHERGWPAYEYAVSCLVKTTMSFVWDSAIDIAVQPSRPLEMAPMDVKTFVEQLQTKTFTNGADREMVGRLYERTVGQVYGGAEKLQMRGRHWGPGEIANFAPLLHYCKLLLYLDLQDNNIGMGVASLCKEFDAGAIPNLKSLVLSENEIGDAEIELLSQSLTRGSLSNLTKLCLDSNGLESDSCIEPLGRAFGNGAGRCLEWLSFSNNSDLPSAAFSKFANVLGADALPSLKQLWMSYTHMDDDGCLALVDALSRGALPNLCSVHLEGSKVTATGKARVQACRKGINADIK